MNTTDRINSDVLSPYSVHALTERVVAIPKFSFECPFYKVGARGGHYNYYNDDTKHIINHYVREVERIVGGVVEDAGGGMVFVSPVNCVYHILDRDGVLLYSSPEVTVGDGFALQKLDIPFMGGFNFPAIECTVFAPVDICVRPWKLHFDASKAVPDWLEDKAVAVRLDVTPSFGLIDDWCDMDFYLPQGFDKKVDRILTINIGRPNPRANTIAYRIDITPKITETHTIQTAETADVTEFSAIVAVAKTIVTEADEIACCFCPRPP